MSENDPKNLCPRSAEPVPTATVPHSPPLELASVWACESPAQADALLAGEIQGYVYQRDRHPNSDQFSEKCRQLHGVEEAAITASGMSALAAALLSQAKSGDHLVVSNQLYGRSLLLFQQEAARLHIDCTAVDACDLVAVDAAMQKNTKLLVVETIANPLLRVADIEALAEIAHSHEALLLVDNTFATPALFQPARHGADLVMESVSKAMNGHSDVMLGMLGGRRELWERVPLVLGTWGLASSPLDCWLALRGLATLPLRITQSCSNASELARRLSEHPKVRSVDYPGLESHPDHDVAQRQFGNQFGAMIAFHIDDDEERVNRFIRDCGETIPFCPSLGEVSTTLSHPRSTSHRGLTEQERRELGISVGTIRLSIGVEDVDYLWKAMERSLNG